MNFQQFSEYFPKIKKIEIDGWEAQLKMVPNLKERWLSPEEILKRNPRDAAVMILFYPNEEQNTHFVLIRRTIYKGVHSDQISFPGGRSEPEDRNMKETALRETYEEVGVAMDQINILKSMSKNFIPASNYYIQPFMGYSTTTPGFKPQESEVKKILQIDLEDLLDENNVIATTIKTKPAIYKDIPAYSFENQIVWGATAMMLSEVKSILKKALY